MVLLALVISCPPRPKAEDEQTCEASIERDWPPQFLCYKVGVTSLRLKTVVHEPEQRRAPPKESGKGAHPCGKDPQTFRWQAPSRFRTCCSTCWSEEIQDGPFLRTESKSPQCEQYCGMKDFSRELPHCQERALPSSGCVISSQNHLRTSCNRPAHAVAITRRSYHARAGQKKKTRHTSGIKKGRNLTSIEPERASVKQADSRVLSASNRSKVFEYVCASVISPDLRRRTQHHVRWRCGRLQK